MSATEAYKAELRDRLKTDDEDKAQKAINENNAWGEFNRAVKALESESCDPSELESLPVLQVGRRRFRNFYVLMIAPFTLIYLRDPVERTANPVLFFHHRDKARRIKELIDSLPKEEL